MANTHLCFYSDKQLARHRETANEIPTYTDPSEAGKDVVHPSTVYDLYKNDLGTEVPVTDAIDVSRRTPEQIATTITDYLKQWPDGRVVAENGQLVRSVTINEDRVAHPEAYQKPKGDFINIELTRRFMRQL